MSTTGTGDAIAAMAWATSVVGAMIAMPSTPWPRKCSSAVCMLSPSNWRMVATDTNQPTTRAASSSPTRVLVGPYRAVAGVTTPSVPDRRVTRVRAALLRR